MKTRQELEQDYVNSYPKPNVLVSLMFIIAGICAGACVCILAYAFVYGFLQIINLII